MVIYIGASYCTCSVAYELKVSLAGLPVLMRHQYASSAPSTIITCHMALD